MRLFFSSGCPYAQRTRALLAVLQQPFDSEEVDLANKSPAFLALSPTGAVPLLEDGDFVLFESAVVNEYLAEKYAWADAFPPGARARAQHRLAMKRFDDVVAPLFFRSLRDATAPDAHPTWRREVDYLGARLADAHPRSLLGLHLATFWQRMTWVRPDAQVVQALRAAGGDFLDAAAAQPELLATAPDRETTVRELLKRFG